jgi:hypothetical protein
MITMIDEIFDRHYQSARADLNGAIASAASHIARAVGDSFKVLHRIEWSAPWEQNSKRARCN